MTKNDGLRDAYSYGDSCGTVQRAHLHFVNWSCIFKSHVGLFGPWQRAYKINCALLPGPIYCRGMELPGRFSLSYLMTQTIYAISYVARYFREHSGPVIKSDDTCDCFRDTEVSGGRVATRRRDYGGVSLGGGRGGRIVFTGRLRGFR